MWLKKFSRLFKETLSLYNIDEAELAKSIHISESAIRQWKTGRNFPSKELLNPIYRFLETSIDKSTNESRAKNLLDIIMGIMEEPIIVGDGELYNNVSRTLTNQLQVCYSRGKNNYIPTTYESSGKIKAVVFDFDGTLTIGKSSLTIWEQIWLKLGYDVKECRRLHSCFDKRNITHEQWCKATEKYFIKRGLSKNMLVELTKSIELIGGCKETFESLANKNIKIYIVSGSILLIIQNVLADLCSKVDLIRANDFVFLDNGILKEIIGTKYDFEGKSKFIIEISTHLKISPKDILFVGNSYNDKYVHCSGAKTLCINPQKTDPSDQIVWNHCIHDCSDLTEILKYV